MFGRQSRFGVGAEPSFAVPASPLIEPESLTSVAPSARQNFSASSVSTRLHRGRRFIMADYDKASPPSPILERIRNG